MNDKVEIEGIEEIFEPEEKTEPTFDELVDQMPELLASMLKSMEKLMSPFTNPRPMMLAELPPRIFKVYRLRFDDPKAEELIETLLNEGWILQYDISIGTEVICVFSSVIRTTAATKQEEETHADN